MRSGILEYDEDISQGFGSVCVLGYLLGFLTWVFQ